MNETEFELGSALEYLIKNLCRGYITLVGTVATVNSDNTCDINVSETTFSSVPIVIETNTQASVYPVPVLGSPCLITFKDGNINQPQLLAFSKIDEMLINCNLWQFNGGKQGGMVLVQKLVTQLNNIENQQNQILNILKGINIPSTPFSFAPIFSSINPLNPTQESQIENKKITQ